MRDGGDEAVRMIRQTHAAGEPAGAIQGKGQGIGRTEAGQQVRGHRVILTHIDGIGRLGRDQGGIQGGHGREGHMQSGQTPQLLVQNFSRQNGAGQFPQPSAGSGLKMIHADRVALFGQIESHGEAARTGAQHRHFPGPRGEAQDLAFELRLANAQPLKQAKVDRAAQILADAELLARGLAQPGRDRRKRHALFQNGPGRVHVALGHGQGEGAGVNTQGTPCPARRGFFLNAFGFPVPQFPLIHAVSLK